MTACLQGPRGQPEQLGSESPRLSVERLLRHSVVQLCKGRRGALCPEEDLTHSTDIGYGGVEAAGLPLAPDGLLYAQCCAWRRRGCGPCLGSFLTLLVALDCQRNVCGDRLCPVQGGSKIQHFRTDFNINNSFSRPTSGQCC